jgi:hypothetical protein
MAGLLGAALAQVRPRLRQFLTVKEQAPPVMVKLEKLCRLGRTWLTCDTGVMTARRWLGIVILGICLGAPIAESLDWWDQALPAGNDTDTGVVIVALSVGLAVAAAATVRHWFQSLVSRSPWSRWLICSDLMSTVAFARPCPTSSPPSQLRI